MTEPEVAEAFDHPEVRSRAAAGAVPRDRLLLRDHVVSADIGAFQPERGAQQRLRFNIAVELRPQDASVGDDVDTILSYDRLVEAVAHELSAERLNLLETLAERVAARILAEPQAERVYLRIEKLDRGPGALGVEIVRAGTGSERAAPPPVPAVCFVARDGMADIPSLLDRLISIGAPVVLVADGPGLAVPVAEGQDAQRRIALLALEQAAWSLAARDARLTVVGTRTEMDWAARQGAAIVWAPSKMTLDLPDAPEGTDALTLARWLAGERGAARLFFHGTVSAPAIGRVPIGPI